MSDFTFFYGQENPLSNWHSCQFEYKGISFNCVEQFMMFCKAKLFKDEEIAAQILASSSPAEQKALGRQVRGFSEELWNEKCRHYVYVGCREKFKQNPELANVLLKSEGQLVEASPYDKIWGIGLEASHPDAQNPEKWPGKNWLGKVLTNVRAELQKDTELSNILAEEKIQKPAEKINSNNFNNLLTRGKKRIKIESRQNAFNFDQIEVLDRLKAQEEIVEDDNANRTGKIIVDSGESSLSQLHDGNKESASNQSVWLGNSRSLGGEQPREAQSPGSRGGQIYQTVDESIGSTSPGNGYLDQRPGLGTIEDGPGASRDTGHARGEDGTVRFGTRLKHIAGAPGDKIEFIPAGFEEKEIIEPEIVPEAPESEKVIESLFTALNNMSSLDGPGIIIDPSDQVTVDLKTPEIIIKPSDYAISNVDQLGQGGAKTKFRDNVEALKTLKRLQNSGASVASLDDQKVLVKYVGWGGLPQAFDLENEKWKKESQELRELLTADEYAQARRSTQDAHYTSQEVIEGVYEAVKRFGLKGGPLEILEPSAGTGNFIGLLPDNLRLEATTTAIELDQITAGIGSYLYPQTTFLNSGFQEVNLPEKHFDLTIGNPPFGNQKIYDPNRPDLDYSIHNYFLAKSIDSLRDGGIGAFVVSRYFLDAINNPARNFLAERANFLGAIRLPNTAFKENALTDVTTDLVFFQKTHTPDLDPAWLNTVQVKVGPDGDEFSINKYFADHPEQMIGHMEMTQNMFRKSADLLPPADFAGFKAEIQKRLENLPQNIYQARTPEELARAAEEKLALKEPVESFAHYKEGAFFVTSEGLLARRVPDLLGDPQYALYEAKNGPEEKRIKGQILVRDALRHQIKLETSPDTNETDLQNGRDRLNTVYDNFVKEFGFLNSAVNKRAMRPDPESPLLLALEREYDQGLSKAVAKKTGQTEREPAAQKADIFNRRVMGPKRKVEKVDTAKEALVVSMNEYGQPNLEFMENISGKSSAELTRELTGLIYLNPANQTWEMADKYLSGNVKNKLALATSAAQKDSRFQVNVEGLQLVQPPDLDPVDISVQLESAWLPPQDIREFAKHLFGQDLRINVDYIPTLGKWSCRINHYQIDSTLNESTWGTDEYPGSKLFEAILTNQPIKIEKEVDRDPETRRPIYKVDEAETAAANQKADEIRQAFQDWIWVDQARRERLAALYNERFNTHVPPKYDGSHLELPGSSLAIELRPHQKAAIWRGIQDGTMLADHVVGAGKTLVCVATAMESKRMGLVKKPMLVVPNHLLNQWRDQFYSLYPGANILVADKDDFKKENREKLFASIATGDWDAVIVAHSSFKKLGVPLEARNKILTEQSDDLAEAIKRAKSAGGDSYSIKEMEKKRERIKATLARKAETGTKDKAVDFGDLGVDCLFVDESQEFKNLYINTSLSRVSGLGNLTGSDKAFDLFVKCRYIQEQNKGRGVFFATGTPISNTIAEMFTVQRYLQYDELKDKGLHHFDSWASTFGQVVTGWELDATGVNYRLNNRFSKFQNVPELVNMYRSFGDVITKQNLELQVETKGITPKIKGGKPRNLVVDRSDMQASYMGVQSPARDINWEIIRDNDGQPCMDWNVGSIIWRMENMPTDPRKDNALKVTNDARKAGLDYRLVDSGAPDFEGSKTNEAAKNIYRIWQEWEADKGTQLVFCDLSTPKTGKFMAQEAPLKGFKVVDFDDDEESVDYVEEESNDEVLAKVAAFSVYDDLKAKLIDLGVPADEIKYIHEANTDLQKEKLFDDVNQGRVRILLGSTAKMGAGTNVQKRLVALHHLDAPWRPSDLEQREGRIIRQGNELHKRAPENFEIEIIRYATSQTYDARMWQTIESKAVGIEQFRRGDSLARTIDDITSEAANAAEMKAAATGNELIFQQVKIASELKKMEAIYASYLRSQHQVEKNIRWLEGAPGRVALERERWAKEIALRDKNTLKDNAFCFGINGKIFGDKQRKDVAGAINKAVEMALLIKEEQVVGNFRGFKVSVDPRSSGKEIDFVLQGSTDQRYRPESLRYDTSEEFSFNGFIQRMNNFMNSFEGHQASAEASLIPSQEKLHIAKKSLGQPFAQMELLEALRMDNREVIREMQITQKDSSYKSTWKPKSFDLMEAKPKPDKSHVTEKPQTQKPRKGLIL